MENKYFIKNCVIVPTEGSSLKTEFDISLGNPEINYFESLKSPSISMTVTFLDVDQMISREGITGGEYINLSIKLPGFEDFKIDADKHRLMLNSVKNVQTTSNKQLATFEFVSVEAIINETSRVSKRFTGNVTDIVTDLLVDDVRGIKTEKDFSDIDRASNSYTFIGNLKRPFDTIQWLCPKAQASKEQFGFLFYETLDGYSFRSIESLLDGEAIEYKKPEKPTNDDFKIIENNFNTSNDIGMNCRMGMYSNKTIYLDIEKGTETVVDYKISEIDLKRPPKLPNGLEDFPTRLMLRVLDQGAVQVGSAKTDIQPKNELAIYQNKSYARNNLLFSQSLSVSIPMNPDLRVGQVMDVKLPLKKSGGDESVDYGSDRSNDMSGRYLIYELRHIIGSGKATTQLQLIRDVFTA